MSKKQQNQIAKILSEAGTKAESLGIDHDYFAYVLFSVCGRILFDYYGKDTLDDIYSEIIEKGKAKK